MLLLAGHDAGQTTETTVGIKNKGNLFQSHPLGFFIHLGQ